MTKIEKINIDKPFNTITGSAVNPGACGANTTNKLFSIGLSKYGQCGCCESTPNNRPSIDLNGGSAGIDVTLAYVEGDPATGIATAATVSDSNSDPLSNIIIHIAGLSPITDDEIIRIGATNYPLNTDATGTASHSGTTFAVEYFKSSNNFVITNSNGGTMPLAACQTMLRAITYLCNLLASEVTDRRIVVIGSDGRTTSLPATVTVEISE